MQLLNEEVSVSLYCQAMWLNRAVGIPSSSTPEVLLHTDTHVLETTTSNIAIQIPSSNPGQPEWVTPQLDSERLPFLDGVMRRHLLAEGVIREGQVTVADWEEAKNEGRRVIGFNGLR